MTTEEDFEPCPEYEEYLREMENNIPKLLIPDNYICMGYTLPKKGDYYIPASGEFELATVDYVNNHFLVFRKIDPPLSYEDSLKTANPAYETATHVLGNPYPSKPFKIPEPIEYDPVNKPMHYNTHPSGIQCIDISKHYCFCLGNAIKYIWRAGLKSEDMLEDLKKSRWYLDQKIKDLENV